MYVYTYFCRLDVSNIMHIYIYIKVTCTLRMHTKKRKQSPDTIFEWKKKSCAYIFLWAVLDKKKMERDVLFSV